MSERPKSLKLNVVGAEEDIPRMLLAYGRVAKDEVALVMRPPEGTALLVVQPKKEAARVWRNASGAAPNATPKTQADPHEAVAEVRKLKANPPPQGPATLRGAWSGALFWDEVGPRVVLERKVATYGVLRLTSTLSGAWTASFVRAEKWFSSAKQEEVTKPALIDAIRAGMGLVTNLVGEACSFRDTHRRNAVDAEYARVHPPKAPVPKKDPTERLQPPKSGPAFALREVDGGWEIIDARGAITARFGPREKGKAQAHLRALQRGEAPAATVSPDIAGAFGLGGMPGVTVIPALEEIPVPDVPSGPVSVARIASATEKEADALGELAQSLWGSTEAPELLGRAAKLIRHAEVLVSSPLCTGKEKAAAKEDLKRAADAYIAARDAIRRGEKPDVVTTLRRISERVSLAAARAAKSCAGQGKKATPKPAEAPPKPKRAPKATEPEVDPEKDRILLGAFRDAIKSVAAELSGGESAA